MEASRTSRFGNRPLLGACLAQLLGCFLALIFAIILPEMMWYPLVLAAIQGGGATIASYHLGAPTWWRLIHLLFGPATLIGAQLPISPWFWLAGFVLLYLVFGRTDQSRVPLFLTNRTAGAALLGLLPSSPCFVADLGCGDGRLLRQLGKARPDSEFVGIEHAWLTYFWAKLAASHLTNVHIRRGSLWKQPLTPFDVTYAFLSPAPMAQLWQKAATEMRPNTLLISNSFAVPDVEPNQIVTVDDKRASQLYCYRISDTELT